MARCLHGLPGVALSGYAAWCETVAVSRRFVAVAVLALSALAGCGAPAPESNVAEPPTSVAATVSAPPLTPSATSDAETTTPSSSYVNPRISTTPDAGQWLTPLTSFPWIEPDSTDERYLHELQSRFGYMPLPYTPYGLDTAVRHAKEFCQLHLDHPDLSVDELVYRFRGRFTLSENQANVVIDVARWHYCPDTWPHT